MSLLRTTQYIKKATLLTACALLVLSASPAAAIGGGLSPEDYSGNSIEFYSATADFGTAICRAPGGSADATTAGVDYDGNQILSQAEMDLIQKNQPVYEKAATQEDIPWQLLAVIHLRETRLKQANPPRGQGIYQFVDKRGGPYPEGPVSSEEFLRQTVLAAKFLKDKASGANLSANRDLTAGASADVIKDTLFSYNGRAGVYATQAARVGFNKETQPFEGSPYVMNRADKKRDPNVNTTTWGQIKSDGGGIQYPANKDYGAFVIYASLSGISMSSCGESDGVRAQVVSLAQQELKLWQGGSSKPSFTKYTNGGQGNWCAWFTSWIYNEAGYPLKEGNNGAVPTVNETRSIGEEGDLFTWHAKTDNYTPKIGDIVVKQNNSSHVHLVTAVNGDKITTIGGNQGFGAGGQATSFQNSIVSEFTYNWKTDPTLTGFVSPKD